ncbi:CshA/CshB family fibrillar adhesin-related protein [Cryobacterium tepidiphilum]|uniref:Tandem-95 repeat protein n=1 Tax=Cryobacterium tepidiphilum TaxID=2486026 RepID=A0A3M8LPZ2_9MICO|nr:CshA/CshB family fibrillar adhesin-related protein [Cryobacterium tepidiphilum]RNE66899.1 tandem-95 repeat protein [Cryobacterium tepidiphilum]
MPALLRVLLAALLASAALVAVPASASAETATGGSGRYVGAIEWMTWGANGAGIDNAGATRTETFTLGDQIVQLTCTIGTVTGTSAGDHLTAYRSASWSGDGLDDLYNVGGSGAANTLVNGLATNNSDTVSFPFDCSASSGGSPFPLEGLVIADAEQLNGTGEYISAQAPGGAVWRLIDRFKAPACAASTTTNATVDASNTLTISNNANCGASGGPSTVLFLDGASSSAKVEMQGGGISALALGVMISTDHGDAPAGYGDAGHLVQTTWTGGDLPAGTATTSLFSSSMSLASPSAPAVRLGAVTDSEINAAAGTTATGDDTADTTGATVATNDEDALAALGRAVVLPGDTYSVTPSCEGGYVAGWVDWNRDGDFADAGERSNTASCSASKAPLSWTVPTATVNSTGTPTYLRLRTALVASEIDLASSKANSGEAEDYTLEVELPTPTANPDTASTGQNTAVTLDPAANDTVHPSRPVTTVIVPASVRLIDPGTSTEVTSLSVAGGSFSVDPSTGGVAFTPAAGFSGAVTPVTYRVADSEGQLAESTLTVTVAAVAPVAVADAASTDQGSARTVSVLGNDQPGNAATPLDPASVVLLGSSGAVVSDAGKTLTVSGEGVYRVAATGTVTFTPDPSFTGTATPVTYRVADADGTTDDAALTITVDPVAPRATADTATTEQNTPVTASPAGNDRPGVDGGAAVDPATVRLRDATSDPVTTVVTTDGTFTVDTDSGDVTFAPAQGFVGTSAVPYQVADENAQVSASSLTVTVTAVAPVAVADAASTDQGSAVTLPVLDNDRAGNAATRLDPAGVVLLGSTAGVVSDAGETLTVAGEGVYRVAADGTVTFTPAAAFTGTATAVTYRVADIDGGTDDATITVTVGPVAPRPTADTAATEQNVAVTIAPADNDRPGVDGGTALDPTTLRLLDADGDPVTSLVTANGTFTVDTDTGDVTFTPAPGFVGAAQVRYQVADENAEVSASTVTVTVTAVSPTAVADAASTDQGSAVGVPVLGNDRPGNAATPLDAGSVVLLGSPGSTVSDAGATLTVAGEGFYRVASDGTVTFTPEPSFIGQTTAARYRVTDVDGTAAEAELTVTVTPVAPRAIADTGTAAPGTSVTIDVTGNDRPGVDGGTALDRRSLRLAAPAVGGAVLAADRLTLTVPGEGEYVVGPNAGQITFTPAAGFTGQATTVPYEISDAAGLTVQGSLTVTIGADVVPAAEDESSFGSVVTFDPMADSGLYFIDGSGARVDTLRVPEGVYAISGDRVEFTPADGFIGTATAVTLYGYDADGTAIAQVLRARVLPPAASTAPAADDSAQLAHTGTESAPFLAAALLLLSLGAALVVGGRRRRRGQHVATRTAGGR